MKRFQRNEASFWFRLLFGVLVCFALFAPKMTEASQLTSTLKEMKTFYVLKQYKKILEKAQVLFSKKRNVQTSPDLAKVYLYLGLGLFHEKHPLLARQAFRKSLAISPELSLPSVESKQVKFLFDGSRENVQNKKQHKDPFIHSAPSPSSRSSGSILPLISWISGAVALVSLTAGVVTGLNAKWNADEAVHMYKEAINNSYEEPLMRPTINDLHDRAVTQSVLANVLYIVGSLAVAASVTTGFLGRASKGNSSSRAMKFNSKSFGSKRYGKVLFQAGGGN